ncbi:MAG: short-chain dehydrogenase/reductase [Actinomycetia bacterium]|nr:short-chain dehydrogenase/reductase [Actinomycetes bacterium]
MNDAPDLRGRTVIVTGASSGIGTATARALHAAGAQPVLAARRTQRLDALSAQLGGALSVQTDVTDADQVAVLVAAALDRHGRIDALVNNAGVSLHDETIEQLDLDQFHRVLDLHVVSVIRLMQAVLPAMRRQGFGRIVNISAGTTGMVIPGVGAYAATKSAVNMLSAVARKELEGIGVTVSVVLPSTTATEFGGGRFKTGQETRPGLITHSPDYVADVILQALRTGQERIDIPHGDEQPELAGTPAR